MAAMRPLTGTRRNSGRVELTVALAGPTWELWSDVMAGPSDRYRVVPPD